MNIEEDKNDLVDFNNWQYNHVSTNVFLLCVFINEDEKYKNPSTMSAVIHCEYFVLGIKKIF